MRGWRSGSFSEWQTPFANELGRSGCFNLEQQSGDGKPGHAEQRHRGSRLDRPETYSKQIKVLALSEYGLEQARRLPFLIVEDVEDVEDDKSRKSRKAKD